VLWATSLVVAVCFSLVIGLNIVLAPAAIVIGMAVGTSARRLSSWTCPRCRAELAPREPEPERALVPLAPPVTSEAFAAPATATPH
jgi:hypothetical protein